ncbi:hypothetical protein FQR65_LT20648 [Abscondita terminalis]|nr:hypothetical protein FQR65_LT20648 [Abscondita terminalis]
MRRLTQFSFASSAQWLRTHSLGDFDHHHGDGTCFALGRGTSTMAFAPNALRHRPLLPTAEREALAFPVEALQGCSYVDEPRLMVAAADTACAVSCGWSRGCKPHPRPQLSQPNTARLKLKGRKAETRAKKPPTQATITVREIADLTSARNSFFGISQESADTPSQKYGHKVASCEPQEITLAEIAAN